MTSSFQTLAERASAVSLRLLGVINMVFLAVFLVTLALSVVQLRAQTDEAACTGINLIEKMQMDDPSALETVRQEAAEVENGKGILWRISGKEKTLSYLFGTMHMSDPRVVQLNEAAQAAFDASSTIVIETTEVLDQAKVMAAMLANPELTMFTDDTTLSSLLPPDERAAFETALVARGIPPSSVEKMKPWVISAMVAMPACELARKASGAPVLDAQLAHDGVAEGKSLGGLETIADQLGAMASLPLEFHIRGLMETLELGDRIDDVIETMIVLYLEEETGMFWPFFRAVLPTAEGKDDGFADFEETMVTSRNRIMAERALPFIEEGGAFIAVGALHLPGPQGLVALLREQGYLVDTIQ